MKLKIKVRDRLIILLLQNKNHIKNKGQTHNNTSQTLQIHQIFNIISSLTIKKIKSHVYVNQIL